MGTAGRDRCLHVTGHPAGDTVPSSAALGPMDSSHQCACWAEEGVGSTVACPQEAPSLLGEKDHRQISKDELYVSCGAGYGGKHRTTQEEESQGQGRVKEGLGRTLHRGTLGSGGTRGLGEQCPGIRHDTCTSIEAGMCSVCVARMPMWLELSGQREWVAGAVGEMGRGPPDSAPSGRVRALETGAEAMRGEPRGERC